MLAIKGEKIETLSEKGTLNNGIILVEKGKIVDVGTEVKIPNDAETIEGKVITPGLIDAHTHIGVLPLERTTEGFVETSDPLTPQLSVVDALDPFDPAFADAAKGGITSVVVHPGSPMSFGQIVEPITIIPGRSAFVKINGRIVKECVGIKMAVGEHPKRYLAELKLSPTTRMGIMAAIRAILEKTKKSMEKKKQQDENLQEEKIEEDPKIEALKGLLQKEFPARVHAHLARDMTAVLRLAKEFDFDVIFEHATEAYIIAETLAKEKIPVVFGPLLFSKRGPELANLSAKSAAILEKAGVLFALTTDHPTLPIQYLRILAGVAEIEGLQNGLKPITLNAAKIAGVFNYVGSLEPGKDADITVFSGDPTEVESKVLYTIVDGEVVHRGS
ncbi:MAG: amidohydrolase family protein [Candidatus Bathyarchaeia archaeon]